MKRYYWLLAAVASVVFATLGAQSANAQQAGVSALWANYSVVPDVEFYPSGLPGAVTQINPDAFLNFVGLADHDDGTADTIPVGFSFDYNGNTYNSVNVNVNGFVTFGGYGTPHSPGFGMSNTHDKINVGGTGQAMTAFIYNSVQPNNTMAPFFGDHYYRGATDIGYIPSTIQYTTSSQNGVKTFWLEWKNLNVNDKTNPNSVATFMLQIRQNPMWNDPATPDQRATFVFEYGPIGSTGNVRTLGASVGADDSVGFTHLNALYSTAAAPDSVRLNATTRTSCWPPVAGTTGANGQSCLPGRIIKIVPQGRGSYMQWGDGDVNLDQIYNPDPAVRNNQNRFVTLTDADLVLQSIANNVPLDSVEGHAAFHADANHIGINGQPSRVFNPNYGAYFYHATEYDAAYIMMYLAGKLAVLPWPNPLPVPGYKSTDAHTTDVSGIFADATDVRVNGNTVLVPIKLRGEVNGALGVAMNVEGDVQFVGTRSVEGSLVRSNATTGKVALALSGRIADGSTIGYLELNSAKNAEFDLTNVIVNDESRANSHVALKLSGNASNGAGVSLEQNIPNPFMLASSSHTTIGFELAGTESVSLRVFDMLGHEVRTLISNETRGAGVNSIEWDGRDAKGNTVASGLYYYQLVTPDFTQTVKMQVVR